MLWVIQGNNYSGLGELKESVDDIWTVNDVRAIQWGRKTRTCQVIEQDLSLFRFSFRMWWDSLEKSSLKSDVGAEEVALVQSTCCSCSGPACVCQHWLSLSQSLVTPSLGRKIMWVNLHVFHQTVEKPGCRRTPVFEQQVKMLRGEEYYEQGNILEV